MSEIQETQKEKGKAGRPLGSASKMAKEARERAQATGLLPHEILLSMARGEPQPVYERTEEGGVRIMRYDTVDLENRRGAAAQAAPYFAPKISTVEVIASIQDAELDQLIESLAAQAGFGTGAGGEGEEGEEGARAERPARRRARL